MIEIIVVCPSCGNATGIIVDFEAYMTWKGGTLIQDAFPDMSASDRKILISGLCSDCQGDMFDEYEEEEDEFEDFEE